jgi:HSP20 family protein
MALLRPLTDMREQMERLFNEMEILHFPTLEEFRPFRDRMARAVLPAVNLSETEKNYLLKVEVPGVKPDDLRVEVLEDVVLVTGESREEQTEEKTGVHRRECSYGRLYRRIPLPGKIKTDEIVAELEHGVLSLTLPKLEEKTTTPIQVKIK